MRSNEGISSIKIHPLIGFCFHPVIFLNIFSIQLFIFISNTLAYFFIVNVVVTLSKILYITAP